MRWVRSHRDAFRDGICGALHEVHQDPDRRRGKAAARQLVLDRVVRDLVVEVCDVDGQDDRIGFTGTQNRRFPDWSHWSGPNSVPSAAGAKR